MKKIFTTLLVSVVVMLGAQAQNLKIHFADGTVQVHAVAAIDSITFEDLAEPAPAIAFTEADGNLYITPNGDLSFIWIDFPEEEVADFGSAEAALKDYINMLVEIELLADETYTGEQVVEIADWFSDPGTYVVIAAGINEEGNITTDIFTHEIMIPESGDPLE